MDREQTHCGFKILHRLCNMNRKQQNGERVLKDILTHGAELQVKCKVGTEEQLSTDKLNQFWGILFQHRSKRGYYDVQIVKAQK